MSKGQRRARALIGSPNLQDGEDGPFTLHYNDYKDGSSKVGKPEKLEVDLVIGADGANSRVAKEIDAGDYDYAIAFQVTAAILQLQIALLILILNM